MKVSREAFHFLHLPYSTVSSTRFRFPLQLLGWMHRRFRSTSGDVFKDLGDGTFTFVCLSARLAT